jgi:hypothetical protein
MKCPYCGNEMLKGDLYGNRVELKWVAKDTHNGIIHALIRGGCPKIETYKCIICNKFISDIPVDEFQ